MKTRECNIGDVVETRDYESRGEPITRFVLTVVQLGVVGWRVYGKRVNGSRAGSLAVILPERDCVRVGRLAPQPLTVTEVDLDCE